MKFKNILFISLICISFSTIKAQETQEDLKNKKFKERLTYNIGGGLNFGTITNISILPQIGYRITPKLSAGVGINFNYFRDNRFSPPDEFMIYGGNTFARFQVIENLFLQTEYQRLNYNNTSGDYVLLGGGYNPGGGLFISGYYILKSPINNVYGAPYILRVGFMF